MAMKNRGYGDVIKGPFEVIRVPKCHEPLISNSNFDQVQKFLTMGQPRSQHPRTVSSQYLLSGLLHCGKCGSAMSGCWAKSGKYFYYGCVKHQKMGEDFCDCHSISKEKIENFIVERLKENVLSEEKY